MCKKIADELIADNWAPDCIVAIAGGGLIPARILRLFLKVPIYTISVRRYDDGEAAHAQPFVTQWLDRGDEQLNGKRILIVDEVDDTRITLGFCTEQLALHAPTNMRVAVLTQKQKPKEADLHALVEKIHAAQDIDDVWVNHPWEARDIDKHNAGQRE